MKQIRWNEGWKFWPDRNSFALVWNVPEDAVDVTIPHDAMILEEARADSRNGGNTGYREGGNYTYVKTMYLEKEETGRKRILRFDGVYSHALVYVNEQLAGTEANGYTMFYTDATPYLHAGENEIRVQVRNAGMTNSRWYSGSGIYRDVWLLESGPLYIEPDGVCVRTENADKEYASLLVCTTVVNEDSAAKTCVLRTAICPGEGNTPDNETVWEETHFFLKAGERRTLSQRILVRDPSLWSEETPSLYTVHCELRDPEKTVDCTSAVTGIRTLELDAARGLRVNGNPVKLRGACIHHDSGLLGAATYEDAHMRQVIRLKEAGFNAIRMSHHPAAPALLRCCDRVGLYVMDEFSDMWNRAKNDLDYALDFPTWWENDAAQLVRKDCNHPSVILYSVGNEIPEIGTDQGSMMCARIADRIRSLDPTRFITAGINGIFAAGDQTGRIMQDICADMQDAGEADGNVNDFMTLVDTRIDQVVVHDAITSRLEMACAGLDVAGYNYMTARYEPDSLRYPNRVMVGSETYPPEIARNWRIVKKLPCVIGDFTWTGWDYIGEAGVGIPAYRFGEGGFGAQFPCQLAYCGDLDLTGFRRPLSYLREIVFGRRKEPYIVVQDPRHYGETLLKTPWVMSDADAVWDWPGYEGKPVVVEVYALGDEVQLYLNGKSLGKKKPEGCRAVFETVYEPGTLRAVCGQDEETVCELRTPLSDRRITLSEDWNGEELVYIAVQITDENGDPAAGPEELLTARVSGAGLLGFGSGDPKPTCNYTEGKTRTWKGRALLILRKREDFRQAYIEVESESGKRAELTV